MIFVLNKSNISLEEIVLLNNNNKVSFVFNSNMKWNLNIMSIKKNLFIYFRKVLLRWMILIPRILFFSRFHFADVSQHK